MTKITSHFFKSELFLHEKYLVVRVATGILMLFACAQISIPIGIVPITLHTVAVTAIGLLYKKKEALYAIFSYIILGICGFPFFSGFSSGISVVLGPKGGYYAGFVLAIYLITSLRERFGDSVVKNIVYVLVGHALIYFLGVAFLSSFVGLNEAIKAGLLPFIFSGIIKSAVSGFIIGYIKS